MEVTDLNEELLSSPEGEHEEFCDFGEDDQLVSDIVSNSIQQYHDSTPEDLGDESVGCDETMNHEE